MQPTRYFRRIRLLIPLCEMPHVHSGLTCQHTSQCAIEAIERLGSSLAIQAAREERLVGQYTLVHLASGRVLCPRTVTTLVQAGHWLQAVAPLFDWTRPLDAFFRPHAGLGTQIEQARLEATGAAIPTRLQ